MKVWNCRNLGTWNGLYFEGDWCVYTRICKRCLLRLFAWLHTSSAVFRNL